MMVKERFSHLICDTCERRFEAGEVKMTCPDCGPDQGTLTVHYPYEQIAEKLNRQVLAERREMSHWRYLEILPVSARPSQLHPRVGWTPLYELDGLARSLGVGKLWIKDDGQNPSASFKDRASSVGVARAMEAGRGVITAASTGNAASSVSLFAACARLRCVIFVPETVPEAKVAQLLMFGAEVLAVKGSYDQAFDLCAQAAEEQNWYCRNTAVNPFLGEGKKTAAMEICEQMAFEAPDAVVVSVGDGCIIGGIHKGFVDFKRLGLIDRIPRIYGVQAQGSSPLVTAFEHGWREAKPEEGTTTCADSINVGHPRDHIKALRAVRETSGAMVAVEDEAILESMRRLAREAGVFAEPAGATGFAGLAKLVAQGAIGKDERVVCMVTGNGLKDVTTAITAVDRQVIPMEASAEALRRWIEAEKS